MPLNIIVIDENRPGSPDCTALLSEDKSIRIAAWSSRAHDTDTLCATHQPDVLLLSVDCLREQNHEWLARVQQHSAATRILLIGDMLSDEALVDCLAVGARGCVLHGAAPLVSKAVHAVHQGEVWISRKMARRVIDRLIESDRNDESPGHINS